MTRNFYNQRRDDSRPSFRNQPPNTHGGERSSRAARPRLNREIVDRAWESGAQFNHADYRSRSNNGPSSHRNRSNSPSPEHSPARYGSGSSRFHSNRQENYRGDIRRPGHPSYKENGSQPYSPRRRDNDEQRSGAYRRNSPNGQGTRSDFRENRQSPRHFRDQGRDNQRSDFRRETRPSHPYEGSARPYRNNANSHRREEQFEGDYERFYNAEPPDARHRPAQFNSKGTRGRSSQQPSDHRKESPTTRLAGGRVLKGPRPAQRKNAQFWNEVARDTDEMLDDIQFPTDGESAKTTHKDQEQDQGLTETSIPPSKPARKTRTGTTRAKQRSKETGDTKKTRSNGPKPSQRGFKWPS